MNTIPSLTRRDLLQRTGAGFGAMAMAGLLHESQAGTSPLDERLPHHPAKAKAVIHLFMNGGPSHVDTFDYKPALEKYHGKRPSAVDVTTERPTGGLMKSPWNFRPGGQCGTMVSDLYPHVRELMDEICVVNSMHTNIPNHAPSLLMMNCGEVQPIRPSMGSWLTYGLGTRNRNLPGYVVLCPGKPLVGTPLWNNSFLPGIFQGTYVDAKKIDPRSVIANLENKTVSRDDQARLLDQVRMLNDQHARARDNHPALEGSIQSMELAFRMQTEAKEAFNVNAESPRTREAYGVGSFAEACLVARRLVERGVRYVQVYYGPGNAWDHHSNIMAHERNARNSDRGIAALIRDLKQRGMLDETLVLWGGEFGRTPTTELANAIERGGGRDHNHLGFSVWMAGGGIKGGIRYGATDEYGLRAVENRCHVHDLHATILHLMGLNHERLTFRYSGRDFRLTDVHGEVMHDVIS
jgi:hypothetical protein